MIHYVQEITWMCQCTFYAEKLFTVQTGITGKSRSSLYRDVAAGTFPAPVKIGQRSVAWRSTDIESWLASLLAKQSAG